MKTQISRDSFQRENRYSGVYLQQGRMILDADWNELSDIEKERLVDALRHAIAGGAPEVGGLKVYADPAGSTNILIQPGSLYVDGVPARLDAAAPLAVNAQPDYPIQADYSGQSLKLYADVWERGVSALEQSALMDAALHGADTASRSQTMLQVKWCANSLDPMNADSNPAMGNAPLTLRLRSIASGGDACDPCASQVRVDERIGNYLFRVEVHDYDAASHWLTLKWSRDNGAEACAVAAMPAGFNQGDWLWEYFDGDTERLLGNHFAPNPLKLRGLLKESCTTPTGANEAKTFVRQWDGSIRIKLDSGALSGRDRGVALFAGTLANQAQGRVQFSGGSLRINLELMELRLDTAGKRFVPGDYWLAEVREAKDESGDTLLAAGLPRGPRHHYLFLGEIAITRRLVLQDDAFKRRMAFPALTDLAAGDVGFTNTCSGLYGAAVNVQQALDNLCAIGAEDIAYPLPACISAAASVGHGLAASLVPVTGGKVSVKTVLDNLLCEFKASDLPLDKSDATLCSDLKVAEAVTVQDALKILCGKSGGGCMVAASSPGHLQTLLQEFAASAGARDLWICLKAGDYPLASLPAMGGKRSLRITGQGAESVAIAFSGTSLSLGAHEIILENLSLTFGNAAGQLSLFGDRCRVEGCHFSRTASADNGPAMIAVGGPSGGVCRMAWRDNRLSAWVRSTTGTGTAWAGSSVVGDATVSAALLGLSQDVVLADKVAYDAALSRTAKLVMAMSPEKRLAWKAKLDLIAAPKAPATRVASADNMKALLTQASVSYQEAVVAVEDMVALWVTDTPDWALLLANHKVGGVIEGCQVDGKLLLGNGVVGYSSPTNIRCVNLTGNVVKGGGEDLQLLSNSLDGLSANIPGAAQDATEALVASVNGHGRITLSGNRFKDYFYTLTATHLLAQGNTWGGIALDLGYTALGYAVVDRIAFTGNLVEANTTSNSIIRATTGTAHIADAGNLMLTVNAMR